jgi:hypothetical protein
MNGSSMNVGFNLWGLYTSSYNIQILAQDLDGSWFTIGVGTLSIYGNDPPPPPDPDPHPCGPDPCEII